MINGLSFGTPWLGAAALLAVPTLLAIHFLQLPSRPERVSTLFLLAHLAPESKGGSRFQQLRNSLPLWLQLLAALLLAWLLSSPRWLRADSRQTLAIILDSSLSMRAFHDQLRLTERLAPLERAAAHTEWILMESDPAAPLLYRGENLRDLAAAAARWTPRLGSHDPAPALSLAQMLVPDASDLLFITDRPASLPPGILALGIGRPVENLGFSGIRTTPEGWEALVRNYGQRPQRATWHIDADRTTPASAKTKITLAPGEAQTLRGVFPASGRLTLILENTEDAFAVDDRLPLILPQAKPLRIALPVEKSALRDWLATFAESLPETSLVPSGADLPIQHQPATKIIRAASRGVTFLHLPTASNRPESAAVAAENHPLVDGLNWQGLITTGTAHFAPQPGDTPLLWRGTQPLIFLRGEHLIVNFDPTYSNAPRLPAFALLLHRYAEATRAALPVMESANVETHQRLPIAAGQGHFLQQPASDLPLRAPGEPQFFTLLEEQPSGTPRVRLQAAAHFADTREADFRAAASFDPIPGIVRQRHEQHSEQDASPPVWLLAITGLMLASWGWQERRPRA